MNYIVQSKRIMARKSPIDESTGVEVNNMNMNINSKSRRESSSSSS